jgi:hypothetical protein
MLPQVWGLILNLPSFFWKNILDFFPLCTIVPVVSAGAVVQTFQKQQGQLGKSEERRAKS